MHSVGIYVRLSVEDMDKQGNVDSRIVRVCQVFCVNLKKDLQNQYRLDIADSIFLTERSGVRKIESVSDFTDPTLFPTEYPVFRV